MTTGRFTKGNQAAARPSKKAAAKLILERLEREGDNLTAAQFTSLTNSFSSLSAKRRSRSSKKLDTSGRLYAGNFDWPWVTPEQAEIHRAVLELEREAARNGKPSCMYSDGSSNADDVFPWDDDQPNKPRELAMAFLQKHQNP